MESYSKVAEVAVCAAALLRVAYSGALLLYELVGERDRYQICRRMLEAGGAIVLLCMVLINH